MQEELTKLQQDLEELKFIVYNHRHKQYDRTKPLPSTSSVTVSDHITSDPVTGSTDGNLVYMQPGTSEDGFGADANIQGGSSLGTGSGGNVNITGGSTQSGAAGEVVIAGGFTNSATDKGADVVLIGGQAVSGKQGDIRVGNLNALATTDDSGFLAIPRMSGAPTGAPAPSAAIVYDTTNNTLYAWNGSAWKSILLT